MSLNDTKKSEYLGKPYKNLLSLCHGNTPILNHMGHNFQWFLAVGVEKECEGTSVLPVNCCFVFAALMLATYVSRVNWALNDKECIFSSWKSLNWIVSDIKLSIVLRK